MKHINKKLLIRGAGKGAPKPKPASYNLLQMRWNDSANFNSYTA